MEKARVAVIGDAMGPMDTGARSVGDAPEDNDSGGADVTDDRPNRSGRRCIN